MNLEWSPLALERVSEIASYIALDKPSAAEAWVDGLFESVEVATGRCIAASRITIFSVRRRWRRSWWWYISPGWLAGLDPTLQEISDLAPDMGAECSGVGQEWVRFPDADD